MSEHRDNLISAYTKAPELLGAVLARIFAKCENPEDVVLHNDAIDTIGQMIGQGQNDLINMTTKVVLDVSRNQKEINEEAAD